MTLLDIQEKLERLTKKWWLYALILIAHLFLPILTEIPYPYEETTNVFIIALSQGLTPHIIIGVIIRSIFLIFLVLIVLVKDKISRAFSLFIAVNYILIGIYQNVVYTEQYGLVFVLGNMTMDFIVAFFFLWEAIIHKNYLTPKKPHIWKLWMIPLAFFAFWWPMNEAGQMDFSASLLIINVGMLAYCSVTPIYLAILFYYYPRVNLATIRMASFIGTYFGVLNMIYWLPSPTTWWLAILHIPLLTISLYLFIKSLRER